VSKALDENDLRSSRADVGEESPRSFGQERTREHRLDTAVAQREYLGVGQASQELRFAELSGIHRLLRMVIGG